MSDSRETRAVLDWLGVAETAVEQLEPYADWLVDEAIPAGGLGPREGPRIWSRHIADSLTFAAGWRQGESPHELLDVGTGVGLPGIPLAIAYPEIRVTLLDRGGRRVRLLHRVVRLLGLDNVVIAQADVHAVADVWHAVTFRGAVPAPEAVGLSARLLDEGGVAVLGLSRKPEPPDRSRDLLGIGTAMGLEMELYPVPDGLLDGPSWLLMMRAP